MSSISDWTKNVRAYHLPKWEELPELSLYLDQVLEYIHSILSPIFIQSTDKESFLTAAMINNYVKHRLIPAPIKKRYHRTHIAFIISMTILKQVTNLNNVSQGTKALTKKLGKEKAYDTFVSYLEKGLKFIVLEINDEVDNVYLTEQTEPHLLPLKMTILAFASKMLAEYLLGNIEKNEGEQQHE